ncbi:MAG: MBOAT family protein [Intestinimonas sp.]|jgi:alginate O-acetyltransferase complex protein AlgI|nr:MBOAT family protein [Intestinimonas sp.]
MLFSSLVFLFAFLPAVLLGYYGILRGMRRAQNGFLLLASLLFYAWGEPWFVLVMMGSILANCGFGLWVHTRRLYHRSVRAPVVAAAACNLGLLFVFKYLAFVLQNLNFLGFGFPVPELGLPIGISFFTFQALSYVLDVATGRAEVQRSPFRLGLYISFFPQLIAGPIVKYATVARALSDRRENWGDFSSGCCRFVVGLGKKVLLANQLAVVTDAAWNTLPSGLSVSMAWLGAACYTLQIYYDFSGYSDMAIGLGRMFGFHFDENFRHPYASVSVTEFWRRWHISLSQWFRDYVYIPLGGNRAGREKLLRNLFVVWLLTGIWHGANWTFLLWGLLYFVLLCLEKFFGLGRGWPSGIGWLYTILMVNFAWVLFRADNLPAAGRYLAAMFGAGGAGGNALFYLQENAVVLTLALLFSLPLADRLSETVEPWLWKNAPHVLPMWGAAYGICLALILLAATSLLVKGTYNPFIYFNF